MWAKEGGSQAALHLIVVNKAMVQEPLRVTAAGKIALEAQRKQVTEQYRLYRGCGNMFLETEMPQKGCQRLDATVKHASNETGSFKGTGSREELGCDCIGK